MTGILTIPSESYHADEVAADRPTLSSSIAHLLCSQSPLHAWAAHPKLNPDARRREEEHLDIGNVAHAILLEGRSVAELVEVVEAKDWRTKAAQEQRDAARAAGRIPLLEHKLAGVEAMVAAAREQLAAHAADPPLLTEGKPERTLVWEEPDGVVCRSLVDWLHDDYGAIDDLKTTSKSADPAKYARALFSVGGDVQAAFYVRGVQRLTGETPEFRWCVVETQPPYALAVIAPAPSVLELGHRKVLRALELWRRCLEEDTWPGYPTRVCYADAPAWEETRWLEREVIEAA